MNLCCLSPAFILLSQRPFPANSYSMIKGKLDGEREHGGRHLGSLCATQRSSTFHHTSLDRRPISSRIQSSSRCKAPLRGLLRCSCQDGFRLGQWVSVQRHNKRRGDTALRRQRLDELGFVWDPHEADWEEGFKRLQAYVKEHKHCRVPGRYKSPDGYNLGLWESNRRRRSSILSPERKAHLAALDFDWKSC